MTIVKAMALAAIGGTLMFGPQLALAKSANNNQTTEHGNSGTAHTNNTTRATERATTNQTDQNAEDDADTEDDADEGAGLGSSKLTVVRVVSALRSGGNTDFSTLTGDITVNTISLADVHAPGNSYVAIEKALASVDQAAIRTDLQANADVMTALTNAGIDVNTVSYAYIDANGNLVVVTQ